MRRAVDVVPRPPQSATRSREKYPPGNTHMQASLIHLNFMGAKRKIEAA
jgi:hypothetical protein